MPFKESTKALTFSSHSETYESFEEACAAAEKFTGTTKYTERSAGERIYMSEDLRKSMLVRRQLDYIPPPDKPPI